VITIVVYVNIFAAFRCRWSNR